jgi:hypothetical protein
MSAVFCNYLFVTAGIPLVNQNLYSYILSGTQRSLRTRHLPFPPRNPRSSLSNRNCQSLKRTLRSVMIIITPQAIHMNSDSRRLRKTLQAMWNHLTAQVSDFLPLQPQIYNTERAVRKVDHGS